MLNRPNWLQEYPDLWEALPAVEDGIPTAAARAALQRILDISGMAVLLRPVLPSNHDARRLSWVCDLLRAAALDVDTPYAKWERERKARHGDVISFATVERKRAQHEPQHAVPLLHAAAEAEVRDVLFNGPPAFERPGPDLRQRRAVLTLYHCAQRPLRLKEPDLCRVLSSLVNAVFSQPKKPPPNKPTKEMTPERVRGIIRAERERLRK